MEKQFPQGIRFNNPHPSAPDFIKGKVSIKVDEFCQYLQENQSNNWVNLILKKSQAGVLYFDLDTWKPNTQRTEKYKSENRVEEEMERQQEKYGNLRTEDNDYTPEINLDEIPFD